MRSRSCLAAALVLLAAPATRAAPLAEKYLHAGDLRWGERDLQRALDKTPADDQLRFGLGVVQFVRAAERFGQALHEHGVKSENANVPFLRIPVPKNPDPTPITYPVLRRIFEQYTDDLARAEATLAKVTDADVTLPLRLAAVKLDLTGDGTPTDDLLGILKKLTRGERFDFLKDNPDFLVRFDRGDVAWLRAYCHLLSAMLDLYLSFDARFLFDRYGDDHFEKPKGQPATKPHMLAFLTTGIRITDPARLHSFRQHMLMVCELNRETWRFIRAERDDDHEWLPHAKQKGVLGLPVTDAMIDAWLGAVGELEGVLEGKKLLDITGPPMVPKGSALNLKAFLDDPPAKLDLPKISRDGVDGKYLGELTDANRLDSRAFNRLTAVFGGLGMPYAAWFN